MLKDNLGVIVALGAAAAVLGFAYKVPFRLETVEGDVRMLKTTVANIGEKLALIERGQDVLGRDLAADRVTFSKMAAGLESMVSSWQAHLQQDIRRDVKVEALERLREDVTTLAATITKESVQANEFRLSIERDIARLTKPKAQTKETQ